MRAHRGAGIMKQTYREPAFFWAGIVTCLAVAAYRLSAGIAGRLHADKWIENLPLGYWFTDISLFWSVTLFFLAWLFWREARRREEELKSIISSVSPDVFMVVNPDRTIFLCNPAVKSMFGSEITAHFHPLLSGVIASHGAKRVGFQSGNTN